MGIAQNSIGFLSIILFGFEGAVKLKKIRIALHGIVNKIIFFCQSS